MRGDITLIYYYLGSKRAWERALIIFDEQEFNIVMQHLTISYLSGLAGS